jgi:hypothetical protein
MIPGKKFLQTILDRRLTEQELAERQFRGALVRKAFEKKPLTPEEQSLLDAATKRIGPEAPQANGKGYATGFPRLRPLFIGGIRYDTLWLLLTICDEQISRRSGSKQ